MQPQNLPTFRLFQFLIVAAAYRLSAVEAFVAPSSSASRVVSSASRVRPLFVVADAPNREEEKTNRGKNGKDDDDDSSWVATKGGFLPKFPGLIKERIAKRKLVPEEVLTIQEYKAVVADEEDQIVCVRFYAPWCKSCKAVEQPFRKLCRDNPSVKFVEVPVTKDNAYLHEGLGIPSLPYGHVYHPEAGLVEERKINKHLFKAFTHVLQTYIDGECEVEYPAEEAALCFDPLMPEEKKDDDKEEK